LNPCAALIKYHPPNHTQLPPPPPCPLRSRGQRKDCRPKECSAARKARHFFQEGTQPPILYGWYADYDKRVHIVTDRQGRSANWPDSKASRRRLDEACRSVRCRGRRRQHEIGDRHSRPAGHCLGCLSFSDVSPALSGSIYLPSRPPVQPAAAHSLFPFCLFCSFKQNGQKGTPHNIYH
jgi:hypothetical protein